MTHDSSAASFLFHLTLELLPDMSTRSLRRIAATLAAVSLSAACTAPERSEPVKPAAPTTTPVERGRYLAIVGACGDCHTPFKMGANGPEPDMSRMLSGHPETMSVTSAPALAPPFAWAGTATNTAFAGPWGISFAMNLTPDVDTGLGSWNEEMFVKALRTGKHMGESRPIQPPMPWSWYGQMSDDDLKALFAYLRSVPAIRNRPPAYQPPGAPPAATK
jgi:mono/diheme cytochrome c family protein